MKRTMREKSMLILGAISDNVFIENTEWNKGDGRGGGKNVATDSSHRQHASEAR
jgi:hypothetical protein